MITKIATLFLFTVFFWYSGVSESYDCNEAVCGIIVTKCLLIEQCKCSLNNFTCYKSCFECLEDRAPECCSCVEICTKPKETALDKQYSACNLSDPNPDLFNILNEVSDPQGRWSVETFPLHKELSNIHAALNQNMKLFMKDKSFENERNETDFFDVNCTVSFISNCLSLQNCKNTCAAMGASRYQWFHDGCCECMGSYCVHGVQESKCRRCSLKEVEKDYDEDYDYGDEDDVN